MSAPVNCNPCCSTETTTQIPGPQGEDAAVVAPAIGDPEGVVTGNPGQTYLNTTDDSFWIKKTGTGNTGWIELIGGAALFIFLFLFASAATAQPVLRTDFTTNTTPAVRLISTNIARGVITWDITKQPASTALTNLSIGDGQNLASNIPASAISGMKWTGVVTNINVTAAATNYMCFTNGILVTNKYNP